MGSANDGHPVAVLTRYPPRGIAPGTPLACHPRAASWPDPRVKRPGACLIRPSAAAPCQVVCALVRVRRNAPSSPRHGVLSTSWPDLFRPSSSCRRTGARLSYAMPPPPAGHSNRMAVSSHAPRSHPAHAHRASLYVVSFGSAGPCPLPELDRRPFLTKCGPRKGVRRRHEYWKVNGASDGGLRGVNDLGVAALLEGRTSPGLSVFQRAGRSAAVSPTAGFAMTPRGYRSSGSALG
jgi:hypothetical protein